MENQYHFITGFTLCNETAVAQPAVVVGQKRASSLMFFHV